MFQKAVWMKLSIQKGWKEREEWRDTEKRGFLEWRWWLSHRQHLFDSSTCLFLPANLNRDIRETVWREILEKRTSLGACGLNSTSAGERFHRWSNPTSAVSRSPAQKVKGSGPGTIYPPFWSDLELSWWHETPPNWRKKKNRTNLLKSFPGEKCTSVSEGLYVRKCVYSVCQTSSHKRETHMINPAVCPSENIWETEIKRVRSPPFTEVPWFTVQEETVVGGYSSLLSFALAAAVFHKEGGV